MEKTTMSVQELSAQMGISLAKVEAAGSSPVSRSFYAHQSFSVINSFMIPRRFPEVIVISGG